MKKLSAIGHKKDRRRILHTLTGLGIVEIANTSELDGTFIDKHVSVCDSISQKIAQLDFAFTFLQESRRELKKKEFSNDVKNNVAFHNAKFGKENVVIKYEDLATIVKDEFELFSAIEILSDISNELAEIKSKKSRIQSTLTQLSIYTSLDVKFSEIQDTKHTSLFVGYTEIEDIEPITTILPDYAKIKYTAVDNGFLLAVAVFKTETDIVARALASINFRKCPFNDDALASDLIAQARSELEVLNQRRRKLYLAVAETFYHLKDFKLLYDFYTIELDKAETMGKCRETARSFVFTAWIPADSEASVIEALSGAGSGIVYEVTDPQPGEVPPSLTINTKAVSAFGDNITSTFGTPEYDSIDPNPFVMFFYCLFFGFMFSDAGYGLIMTIACALYLLIKKPVKRSGGFFLMFMFCGISTIIWGTLFGGWFGLTAEQLSSNPVGKFLLSLQVLNSMDGTDILIMFGIALGLGVVQLAAGFALNGITLIKNKQSLNGVLNHFSWVIILCGGAVAVFGMLLSISALSTIGGLFAGIGVLMLLAGGAVGKKNPLSMLAGAFKNLYGSINVFSDILSYSRLFSLCLTTGIIGMVINIIAGLMPSLLSYFGYVVAFIIYAFGHLFNFAINALGVYVHDSRLQYVEFFGKFFSGEGRAFQPLGSGSKYIHISEGISISSKVKN
ncbi:MAG: V-type ATP synthase subunit I [Christensenellaceae bacterium]|jgi:V/A-type H+-transporting ATPase subunit I|nr:V-type ATP synthase subunit I [Christensenellaceae bacterium]